MASNTRTKENEPEGITRETEVIEEVTTGV